MTTPPAEGEVRQLLVHPAVWPGLESWLLQRGIEIAELGVLGDDDLPTYVMTPATPAA
ncbi:hypothetical protein [Streptomyces sp. CFMR 7]|uniref:hypothetical protein n=1 Tax=Streptomyces sp. CFMR 7 TaxID=1649184 RepID=UPI001642A9E2|nr:hypothetical protein [Streptomyces sp. CFMR 7]